MNILALVLSSAAVCSARQVQSSELQADALHGITRKCLEHDDYVNCVNYATSELAACSPDDLTCRQTNTARTHEFCCEECGASDYIPVALAEFLEIPHLEQVLVRRDAAEKRALVLGNKEITASEITEAVVLKQLSETQDHPPTSRQVIEEQFKPAVSNVRHALERPREDSAGQKHKRLVGDDAVEQLETSQTGENLPLREADELNGGDDYEASSTGRAGNAASLFQPYYGPYVTDNDEFKSSNSDHEIALSEYLDFIDPKPKAVFDAVWTPYDDEHADQPQASSNYEPVYMYQDVPSITVASTHEHPLPTSTTSQPAGILDKVWLKLKVHKVGTQPVSPEIVATSTNSQETQLRTQPDALPTTAGIRSAERTRNASSTYSATFASQSHTQFTPQTSQGNSNAQLLTPTLGLLSLLSLLLVLAL